MSTKKISICLLGLCVAVSSVFAEQAKEAGDKAHWGVTAIRSNGDVDTDGGVVSAGSVTATEAVVDGKYATVGPDATTGLMIQSGNVTAVGTLETNTFAVAFGAAPVVMLTSEEATTGVSPWVGTVTASNFTCTVESSKDYAYVAIGARP